MGTSRQPVGTYDFIDEHCQMYQWLFSDIRSFEAFKFLIIGMLYDVQPKYPFTIAQAVGLKDGQSLLRLLKSPGWQVEKIRTTRLNCIRQHIGEQAVVLCINERFCYKDRQAIDYVCLQENNRSGRIANSIISINSYAIIDRTVYPLLFKVFKPKSRLKSGDQYKTKSEIALELIREINKAGFRVELILAESLHDEETNFISMMKQLTLPYIISVHRLRDALFAPEQLIYTGRWRTYNLMGWRNPQSQCQIREVKFSHSKNLHCYEMPHWRMRKRDESESESEFNFVYSNFNMTRMLQVTERYCWWAWNNDYYERLNGTLGWEDFQINDYFRIERWWELVFCAYLVASFWAHQDAKWLSSSNGVQKSMVDFPFHDRLRRQVEIRN